MTNCALTAEWSIASYSRASSAESMTSGSRMRVSIRIIRIYHRDTEDTEKNLIEIMQMLQCMSEIVRIRIQHFALIICILHSCLCALRVSVVNSYGLITILPASAPDLPTVLSSCRRWASAAWSSGSTRSMRGLSLPAASQRLMSSAAARLLFGRGVEHGEAEQAAVLRVERADGKDRAGVAAGHEDHPAPRGQQRNRLLEVRLAHGFPPDVDAVRCEFLDAGRRRPLACS